MIAGLVLFLALALGQTAQQTETLDLRQAPNPAAQPAQAQPDAPKKFGQIRTASSIAARNKLGGNDPVYPENARSEHITGTVVLDAVIGKDGLIEHLQVVSGPIALRNAALDAVKTWRYKPMRLNGEPVEVATQISVNFTISHWD